MNSLLLLIDPEDVLTFEFVPGVTIKSGLRLKNLSATNVAFKVKTTAPKTYLVRPSQGVIGSHQTENLTIIMNPLDEHPGEVSHKFLVQACETSLLPGESSAQVIQDEFGHASDVQSKKLAVVISEPSGRRPASSPADRDEDTEQIRSEIAELERLLQKNEERKAELNVELQAIQKEMQTKTADATKPEPASFQGFTTMHLAVAFLVGLSLGYVSS